MKMFHIHKWCSWSDPQNTNHGYTKIQARYCTECNRCQVKKIKQPWNIWFGVDAILKKASEK